MFKKVIIALFLLVLPAVAEAADTPLFGLFEKEITNSESYGNPFADVDLVGEFKSPSGQATKVYGFYAGDGKGGNSGNVWKIRFMPDQLGKWTYTYSFSDSTTTISGRFSCVQNGGKPGPWVQDENNRRWIKAADGSRFFPIIVLAGIGFEIDYKDSVEWCLKEGYNTILAGTFETNNWWETYPDSTAFQGTKRNVDYTRYNIAMWDLWDEAIQYAGEHNIYVSSFSGPHGEYGGQRRNKYPPDVLVMLPKFDESPLSETNKVLIRYLIARQGAFWNLANWSLGGTEVYNKVETQSEFINYIEFFASHTPWRRMITAQDCEQWHGSNRRWISAANIPISRKLNFVQTAVSSRAYPRWGASNKDNTTWQRTDINNEFALDSYGGFPTIGTEALWECQGRAQDPLAIIMGFLTAGAYTTWADWCYDDGIEGGRWGSIGRHWIPLKPLSEHLYSSKQIGLDCVGDEQLKNVSDVVQTLEYWKMSPHNELAGPDNDVFCLAEPGKQYLLYVPAGGSIDLNLSGNKSTEYKAYWYDPTRGSSQTAFTVYGGNQSFSAPTESKWILVVEFQRSQAS